MITVSEATESGVRALSRKLLKLLEDKNSQIYQDNVAKFGIPKEYVKKAFSEKTLLEALLLQKQRYTLPSKTDAKPWVLPKPSSEKQTRQNSIES